MTFSIGDDIIYINKKSKEIPIAHFIFEGKLGDEDFLTFKEKFKELFIKHKYFAIIFNLKDVDNVSPPLIIKLADFMKLMDNFIKEQLISSTILIDNKLIRVILNKLFAIRKPIAPNYITMDYNDGLEFVKDNISIDKRAKNLN